MNLTSSSGWTRDALISIPGPGHLLERGPHSWWKVVSQELEDVPAGHEVQVIPCDSEACGNGAVVLARVNGGLSLRRIGAGRRGDGMEILGRAVYMCHAVA